MELRPFSNRQMHIETVRRAHCLFSNRQIRIRSVRRPRRSFFFRQVKAAGNPLWIPEDLYAAGRKRGKRAACRDDSVLPVIKIKRSKQSASTVEMAARKGGISETDDSTPQSNCDSRMDVLQTPNNPALNRVIISAEAPFAPHRRLLRACWEILIVSAPLYLCLTVI